MDYEPSAPKMLSSNDLKNPHQFVEEKGLTEYGKRPRANQDDYGTNVTWQRQTRISKDPELDRFEPSDQTPGLVYLTKEEIIARDFADRKRDIERRSRLKDTEPTSLTPEELDQFSPNGNREAEDIIYRIQNEKMTPTEEKRLEFRFKLQSHTRIHTPEKTHIPGRTYFERNWPFPNQVWEYMPDGKKYYRDAETFRKEVSLAKDDWQTIQLAKATGRFDLIQNNDLVTQEDILEIAKTAAERALSSEEAQRQQANNDAEIIRQRAEEHLTGEPGKLYDPHMNLEYARELLDIKYQKDLENYQQWLQQKHERRQMEIKHEIEQENLGKMRDEMNNVPERPNRFVKFVNKLLKRS